MVVLTFETCWAVNSEIIKQVTSSWSIFVQQALLIRCSVKNLSIRHALSTTAFCVRIYRAGRTYSSFKLSRNLCLTLSLLVVHNIYWHYIGRVQLLHSCLLFFLGAFTKLRKKKPIISFVMPVRLSAWNNSASHWTDISLNLIFECFFKNPSRKYKLHENRQELWILYITMYVHFCSYLTQFFLEWETFQTKVVEKTKTHTLCSITLFFFLPVSCLTWDNVEKYCRAYRQQKTMWRMHIACRVPKATNTHSEHVGLIRIAFTLQQ